MLNSFPGGNPPGVEKGTLFPSRDRASFLDLHVAAIKLQRGCSQDRHQPGWVPEVEFSARALIIAASEEGHSVVVRRDAD